MLRSLKRVISQFFETEYWYRFRKIGYSWFDDYGSDATNKYRWNYIRAGKQLACTWEGEKDILDMMRLKIEHMFWNLKKYGNIAYCYLDNYEVLKNGSKSDKVFIAQKVIEQYDFEYKTKENQWCSKCHEEWWTDLTLKVKSPKKTRKCKYHNYTTRILVGRIEDKKLYFIHENYFDGAGQLDKWSIQSKDLQVELPFNCKLTEIQKILDEKGLKINFIEGLINYSMSIDLDPAKDLSRLSSKLRKEVRGERQILVDLLTLRHAVKKLAGLEDLDDKYTKIWENSLNKEEKIKEAGKLFLSDRKELYYKVVNLMIERGRDWWD